MTLVLDGQAIEVANVAEAYKLLRQQGIGIRDSDTPPEEGTLKQWRRRVSDLVNMKNPVDPKKDLLNIQLQNALEAIEEQILIKFPQLQ